MTDTVREAMSIEDQLQIIVRYVANAFHVALDRVAAYRNDREATQVRDVIIWISDRVTKAEVEQIVQAVCRRDKGVLSSALNRIEDKRYADMDFRRRVDDIKAEVLAAFAIDGGYVRSREKPSRVAQCARDIDLINWGFQKTNPLAGRAELELQNRKFAAAMVAAGYKPSEALGAS